MKQCCKFYIKNINLLNSNNKMGSKFSKSNNEEVKIGPQYWGTNTNNNSIKYNKYDCDTFSTSEQTQENTESTIVSTRPVTEKEKLYPFKFEWKGLGSTVILAGSFLDNWKDFKPMIKNQETEIFELIINLPKKIHYFKFIVDNKWVCSNQYQTTVDNSNNQNNFIDLTNYVPPDYLVKMEENKKTKNKSHKRKVIVLDMNDIKKNNYNCKYPLFHELNTTAPSVIQHYEPCFNIDYQSNQDNLKKLSKKKGLNYKEKNTLTENNTYKKILPCPHEKLMHFCQNINDLKNTKKRYVRGCATIRNKHKYLTVIYYKPKPNKMIENIDF